MDAEILIKKGDACLAEGMFAMAIESFTKAIAAEPRRAAAYCRRAKAYYASLLARLGKAPNDPEKFEEFERSIRGREELDLSLKDLKAALSCDPGLAEAHFNIGVIQYSKGRHRDAARSFGKAIALDESNIDAYYHRVMAYEQLEDLPRALADLDAITRIAPAYAEAFLERGVIFSGQGKHADAVREIDKAIALEPGEAKYHYHRSMAISTPAFDTRDFAALQEAQDGMSEAIRLDPGYAEAYFHRSFLYGLLGQPQKELDDLTAAIRLDPDYAAAYRERFQCQVQLGRKKQAVRDWGQFCARSKESARIDLPAGLRRNHSLN